jgi:hypothetical protein
MKHQHTRLFAGLVFVLVSVVTPSTASAQTEDQALAQFNAAVEKYVALQRSLRAEVPDLQPNSDPKLIAEASDLLAIAIQRARPRARQGDFFNPGIRPSLQARVTQGLRNVDYLALIGANDPEERSSLRFIRTYSRFPGNGPMATMPASVLEALPALPDELEYRFVGNNLILRDRHARLILDYVRITPPKLSTAQ